MIGIHKVGRVLVATLLIAAAFGTAGVALTAATATPAYALCQSTPIVGTWHNINSNTNAMTRAVISQDCNDQQSCNVDTGQCTGGTGPGAYHAHMYGKCSPQDCDWGTVVATDRGSGWLLATYNFGFKTSYVWLKTYDYYGSTYLRVYVNNVFAPGDGRANYVTDEWFLK